MVTGGAGFIGSHTVDALLQSGLRVWVLGDLSSGLLSNLSQWKKNPNLHFKRGDVTKYKTVASLAPKVEAIIHLAALVSPNISIQKPELAHQVNVSGTMNVLRAGVKHSIRRIVFASSSSVYGDAEERSKINENAKLDPITPYGASKLAAEKYCQAFCKSYGLGTISLRYFNVYGARQSSNPYSGVIAIFAQRLLKGLPPIIYGDGLQTRDFIHVSDAVNANLLALRSTKETGEAVNIGTGRATTIEGLYHLLARLMARDRISPRFADARPGDIRASCADIAKARMSLGFEPRIPLRSGLRLLCEWLDSRQTVSPQKRRNSQSFLAEPGAERDGASTQATS